MKTSIPILRRVRFKTGQSLEVLRPPRPEVDSDDVLKACQTAVDNQDGRPLGGYAIVVWGRDGSTTAAVFGGTMPRVMVPQLVKDRVLLEIARQWIAPLDEEVTKDGA